MSNDDDCKVVISPDRSKLRLKVDSFGDRDMFAEQMKDMNKSSLTPNNMTTISGGPRRAGSFLSNGSDFRRRMTVQFKSTNQFLTSSDKKDIEEKEKLISELESKLYQLQSEKLALENTMQTM